MRVRLDDVPREEWSSPRGSIRGSGRQVSLALAAQDANAGCGLEHPFDLELGKLPPGKSGCPFHSHANQWELFLITHGRGEVRYGGKRRTVAEGDAVMHPPGEAHQLLNTGTDELHYYLVADNPSVDYFLLSRLAQMGNQGQRVFPATGRPLLLG